MASAFISHTTSSLEALTNENSLKSNKYDESESLLISTSSQDIAASDLVNNLSSSTSTNASSTSNSNNSSNEDEDEDCFYDAVDACADTIPEHFLIESNLNQLENRQNSDTDDDCKQFFFDTTTSRHPSEMNFPLVKNSEKDSVKIEVNLADEGEESDCEDAELETPWSFWIDKCVRGTTKNEYEAGLKLIHTVNTVQTFWSVFNNIPDVSALPNRFSYHLMRHKRRPLWEDPENVKGGQWKFKCKKEDTSVVWSEVNLASIGEQLSDCVSPADDIVGISVSRREKDDVIQIWNLDQTYHSQATIYEKLQELVPSVKFSVKFYKAHSLHEAFEGKDSSQNTNLNKGHYNKKKSSPESKNTKKNNAKTNKYNRSNNSK